ncbi:tol-pal system-associated acyl-CoA thioesterase [Marinobacter nanhaiticus D15-8W]|uniref:Tol-pal system-associated acyl-CoA thioesterase n=1 Tax=Marinobacter nanhaiticus D15-8W TaxID=626887 RepID=N6VVY7_9GAMM|nr:tol-pal system-associated acyl-CoA thioesterase [Marinobacter nanhaiticus]ENO14360.1 tol-pal system-associated acyl-CoA thioesterase [Marinobacter nanhaiticus D15-8W]BES71748.1 tol-pal system-associated acyl-CoA thioesterase [Marinobacter nanhaiticus D15-8W]
MAVTPDSFRWPIRVYIEDTDAGGIVYHARYLHFMERARTEWVRSQGVALRSGLEENVSYVVQKMSIHFRQPAKLDDEIWVTADLVECGRVWMGFNQRVIRQSDGALLTEADVKVACVALDTGRPRALPDAMRAIAGAESAKEKTE